MYLLQEKKRVALRLARTKLDSKCTRDQLTIAVEELQLVVSAIVGLFP